MFAHCLDTQAVQRHPLDIVYGPAPAPRQAQLAAAPHQRHPAPRVRTPLRLAAREAHSFPHTGTMDKLGVQCFVKFVVSQVVMLDVYSGGLSEEGK